MSSHISNENGAPKSNAIVRALDFLEYMIDHPQPVSLAELSREFSINRTTTSNLLDSLRQKGYVSRNEAGRFQATSRLFELGMVYQNRFPIVHLVKRKSFSFLDKLRYTLKLTVLTDDLRAMILYSRSNEDHALNLPVGYGMPLQTSASGKVLLAWSPSELLDRFLAEAEFQKYTENTIVDKSRYREEIGRVVENGYALDNCEYYYGQLCIAAPVMNRTGELEAAVSVSGSEDELRPLLDQLIGGLTASTKGLSLEMGYPIRP